MSQRLPAKPGQAIDRDKPLGFRFDGKQIAAFEGDTVGSALAAAGVTITGRSFKYHRPRGLTCMAGSCSNCLMQIDGVPNVRSCTEPVRQGMQVQRQNAWPSLDRDFHSILDRFSFMMPTGFYYKVFQHPKWAWKTVEPLIRSQAGLGKVPSDADHAPRKRIDLHPEVVVIGAGSAGLAAAAEAAKAGASVIVLEQGPEAGGALLRSANPEQRSALVAEAQGAGAQLLTATAAFGIFDGPLVAAAGDSTLYRVRARHVIVATGAVEQPLVFPNNDLPGVMLSSAADLLVNRFAVAPAERTVVFTSGDAGYATARSLRDAGASVIVVDLRPDPPTEDGLKVIAGSTILAAGGKRHITEVTVGRPGDSSGRRIPCGALVLAGFTVPSTNLLAMSGAEVAFDERSQSFLPVALPSNVHAVGAVAGAASFEAAIAQGRLAGIEAAEALGHKATGTKKTVTDLRALAAEMGDQVVLPPEVGVGDGKQFACFCMDVTHKELKTAVSEGFDSMELLKRYTTINMGPCQGKSCMLSSQRLCGSATGKSLPETKPTTARPPWTPVELGTLAGWRRTPQKQTSIHDLHTDADASFMWAGDWKRAHHYVGAEAEVAAVRSRVGVIDVSSLGKFRVKGPGAVELLERLYPSRFSDLAIGRIRYGLMLNDEGVIIDDGTVYRVSDDEFFVTVTTGNTAALERWMTWWQADWNFDVRLLNLTGALAAINLAGPNARTVMQRLTDADISAEAFPYMSGRRIDVAGVSSLVLRIGFVGEMGYEIHFPSMYGEHVWQRIMQAGADQQIARFGLEAQRILRLEKQHILVGQDTDAESDPYEVGMGWTVKADKPDFLGKRSLEDLEKDGPSERLVGFTAEGSWVPPEGASVVHEGAWVGRVTSSRRSEAAASIVGLAWVPADWAVPGTPFRIEFGSKAAQAKVVMEPFYDPSGARLRS
jgi:sarcosine oxidase, subunit alpha